ncbi:MAG: hypothetical protein ACRDMV_15290, partial [Streptosporangiales bacterium]
FTEVARVSVEVYAASSSAARDIAKTIQQRLISGPTPTDHGVLDQATAEVGPHKVSAGSRSDAMRLCAATYRVSTRR